MALRTAWGRALALLAVLVCSTTAQAQIFRAYLASDGNDANPCTLSAPCRLLPAALDAVASGGEIWMLDSANYNTSSVTIGKSVSILAVPGAIGSVLAIGGPAVQVLANGLNVSLRNIVIAPFPGGGGTDGVAIFGTSSITIEHSLITGVPLDGVSVAGAGSLKVANTTIKGAGSFGISLGNGAYAEISRVLLLDNQEGGVYVGTTIPTTTRATISDSTISGGTAGIATESTAFSGISRAYLTRSTVSKTTYALRAGTGAGSAAVTVAGSTIAANVYAFYVEAGGVVASSGNNTFVDNPTQLGSLTNIGLF